MLFRYILCDLQLAEQTEQNAFYCTMELVKRYLTISETGLCRFDRILITACSGILNTGDAEKCMTTIHTDTIV